MPLKWFSVITSSFPINKNENIYRFHKMIGLPASVSCSSLHAEDHFAAECLYKLLSLILDFAYFTLLNCVFKVPVLVLAVR